MKNNKNNLTPALIGVVILLLLLNLIHLYFYQQLKHANSTLQQKVNDQSIKINTLMNATDKPLMTLAPQQTNTIVSTTQTPFNPVKIDTGTIQYELPEGWNVSKDNGDLHFTRASGGGYIYITAYTYNGTGRREFYCNIMKTCIPQTAFTATSIGNISGYMASGLDNSGGGNDYFGAKSNSFYIITSYNPDNGTPNSFMESRIKLFRSLIF